MATERILVHSSVRSQFVEELKNAIDVLFNSGPVPILVNKASVEKNKKLVSEAVSGGAKLLSGDVNAKEETDTRLRPIVVEGVKKDMNLYYQESFGPSVSLFTVESEEEAVQVANDTEYGLTCAIFTKDLLRGFRVAKQIESG
jgi:acyl-CoA reductase-like NAD-dependent aldehyde dehydrogenase